jgi:L-amino acid N-acyltransferase YncA
MFSGTIRTLEQEDIDSVEKIFDMYWSGEFRQHLSRRLPSADLNWIVAEEGNEVVGVAGWREAPERMRQYAKSDRVVEFYVAAARYKGKGIGTALRNARITEARKAGYKEAVFFSGNTHQDSWGFHDNSDFRRMGGAVAPDGEEGQIWLMSL